MPAGLLIGDAAAWVGHACWAELRLHEALTGWLTVETDDAAAAQLWSVRSAAAERASAWHRRLPELREMPRADFVSPSSKEVAGWFDDLAAAGIGTVDRRAAAQVAVQALRAGYEAHAEVAVGPADDPVARTLADAIASIRSVNPQAATAGDAARAALPLGPAPSLP